MRSLARLFLLSLLVVSCAPEQPAAAGDASAEVTGPAELGKPMPPYSAELLGGGELDLAGRDEVVLLNIWATWCGPCRAEIPDLIALQNEYGSRGFTVIGASIDSPATADRVGPFAKEFGINYPIALDPKARIADIFEASVIPTSALLDRDGTVVWMEIGVVDAQDPELRSAIERSL